MLALVVGGYSDINPVKWGVGVAKSDDWDVHVGRLSKSLVVNAWVANDQKAGLQELLGVMVGKSTWDPFSTKVVGTSVGTELKNSALSVLARRHDLKLKDDRL